MLLGDSLAWGPLSLHRALPKATVLEKLIGEVVELMIINSEWPKLQVSLCFLVGLRSLPLHLTIFQAILKTKGGIYNISC